MNNSRRDFIKKAGYVAPAVLTMTTMPAMASFGSQESGGAELTDYVQPARWQTKEKRNRLRRLERQGIEVDRFDWSRVDPITWTMKD